MINKVIVFLTVLLIGFLCTVNAYNVTWTGAGDGTSWDSIANWDTFMLPESTDWALINGPAHDVVIDTTGDAVTLNARVALSADANLTIESTGDLEILNAFYAGFGTGGVGQININGGDLDVAGIFSCGYGGQGTINQTGGNVNVVKTLYLGHLSAGSGSLNIASGSVFDVNNIIVGRSGTGQLTMTGGELNIAELLEVASESGSEASVYLNDGVLSASDIIVNASGEGTPLLDVSEGSLILQGDKVEKIESYITNGWFTAYGSIRHNVLVNYSSDSNETTVTGQLGDSAVAWGPSPSSGSNVESLDGIVTLGWNAGDYAPTSNGHYVYLGTSPDSLALVSSPSQPQTATSYGPVTLDLNKTYYWRVNEVNQGTSGVDVGPVWNFRVTYAMVIDGFETYGDVSALLSVWKDGTTSPANGSSSDLTQVSQMVYKGKQALEYTFDNSVSPYYSEMERSVPVTDFTASEVKSLDIWYRGAISNAEEPMYVSFSDGANVATIVNSDSKAAQAGSWTVWRLPITECTDANPSLNLANIQKIYLGFGDKANPAQGGQGVIYIDAVQLFEKRCIGSSMDEDLNGDCLVDFKDFAMIASSWLENNLWP
jgi:hypothetical protein